MKRKPFATAKKWSKGWYAVAGIGITSGPWETELEANRIVDKWNAATTLD